MSKKILYIEDDKNNKALVRKILTARGYEIFEADNGIDGIEKAKECRPDLVLMDINMPGLDGLETTTRLKGLAELKEIPVIAVSALVKEEARERGLIAGCDGYITKPIDVRGFAATLERYLGGARDRVDEARENELLRDYSHYLVESLEDKVRKLKAMNEQLESRVEERTRELKEAQERLLLMEKKKTLLEFTGAAAHEINQPLTVIMSLSEVVLSDMDEDDENYEYVRKIKDECIKAAGIVKKIGNISEYRTKKYYNGINIIDIDESSP